MKTLDRAEIIEVINFQVKRNNKNLEFSDLLLWINVTNGYLSCHWYNFEDEITDEDDLYSVLELPKLFDFLISSNELGFYKLVLSAIKKINIKDIQNESKLNIYETWEINDPELLFKL